MPYETNLTSGLVEPVPCNRLAIVFYIVIKLIYLAIKGKS